MTDPFPFGYSDDNKKDTFISGGIDEHGLKRYV